MRQLLLSLVLVLFAFSAHASDEENVKQFANNLASRALGIVADVSLSDIGKRDKLENLFRASVDIPWVAQFVMGKHWRTATDEQKRQYLANYETFVLRNYTSKIVEYTGREYKILNVRQDADGEFLLTMELVNQGDPNVLLDYRIRKTAGGFKIFDIVVEGVSMITTQRSEFGAVISNKGIDFLISALEKRIKAAS